MLYNVPTKRKTARKSTINLIAIENMFKQRKIPLDIRSKLVAFHALAIVTVINNINKVENRYLYVPKRPEASQLRFEIKTFLRSNGNVDSPSPHKVHRLLRRNPSPCFRAAMTGPIRSARLRSEPSISHRWTPRVSSTCFPIQSKLRKQNLWTKPLKTCATALERKLSVMPAC